ncbi:heavy metal-associated isoprenylated plant protein 35 [Medicago truncatula]|uniref:Heavy metal transport/detoxification domain protein n=2 Tax=Medicago truncatula TaxID=3880 RepID=A0A072V618_MEDTR|nr:heavy metal-associated isoprenylated plant protein 35 [Medicago truncatula]KEH37267.1 heavy metal transport/detoxification domain protein [Medicago truncatula]
MDAKPKPSSEPLKYQTWFLKVSIHCEGCRKKVKKVLKRIDGVFTATIDSQQQKVTVTGNVGVETLLRKLVKAGKYAEIWPENLDGKGKSSGKEKKKKKDQNEPTEVQSLQNKGTESVTKCENEGKNKNKKSKTDAGELPEKSPAGNHVPPVSGGGGSDNNKKKKKKKKKDECGGNGNGSDGLTTVAKSGPAHSGFQFQNLGQTMAHQVNLSPTRQQSILYPSETGYYPSMVYMSSAYNRLYPTGRVGDPSYYVPSSPYTCPTSFVDQYGSYQVQSGPLVPFELFSDENASGCSIM